MEFQLVNEYPFLSGGRTTDLTSLEIPNIFTLIRKVKKMKNSKLLKEAIDDKNIRKLPIANAKNPVEKFAQETQSILSKKLQSEMEEEEDDDVEEVRGS